MKIRYNVKLITVASPQNGFYENFWEKKNSAKL
jgi:hypothetical protein